MIKTDAAVCCRSQVSSLWDISHSPPARGSFAAATLPSKRHKPATSGMQKQQHFPCKSPSAARQEGLEITPPRCSGLPCLRTLHSWKICSVHVSAADPSTAPGRQQDFAVCCLPRGHRLGACTHTAPATPRSWARSCRAGAVHPGAAFIPLLPFPCAQQCLHAAKNDCLIFFSREGNFCRDKRGSC